MWPVIVVLVFAIALAVNPFNGDGWFWEMGNAVGFLALALLLVLVLNGRANLGRSFRHRWLGITVFLAVVAHSLWFLVGDPVTWEYLKWGSPHYMVAGILSAGLVLLTTLTSLISLRKQSYNGYRYFQKWHQRLTIAIVLTAIIHVVLSGFYIQQIWQIALLLVVTLGVCYLPIREKLKGSFQLRHILIVASLMLSGFVLLRIATDL